MSSERGVAVVPFCGTITNWQMGLLRRKNIKAVARPPLKIKHLMCIMKDPLGLNAPGIYNTPCSCGQSGTTVVIRETEHKHHLCLRNVDKSAVALHGWNTGHTIKFEETVLLYRSSNWIERTIQESLEIQLCPYTMNKEDGLTMTINEIEHSRLQLRGSTVHSCLMKERN